MTACWPHEVIEHFAAYVSARDLSQVAALYEPDAVYFPRPGRQVRGERITAAFASLLTMEPTMTGAMKRVIEAGDIALANNSWQIQGRHPDGRPLQAEGVSAVVLRRRANGSWGMLIDDPWALSELTAAS